MQQSLRQSSVVMLKRPKFYAMISVFVLIVLAFIASFGVYYKQYTNLMKIYQRQYAKLQHYQKSECSSDDPNPTYGITMRYHSIGDIQPLFSAQAEVPSGGDQSESQVAYHQKIYQIKTLPAKRAQLDVLKYNLTHHHIEKLSSGTIKSDDIDNVLLFRSDGSINIITYDEYLVEEELIKNLSDEELGFEKPDTRNVQLQRHNLLGVLEDRTSLYVSGNILGNVQANALEGNITLTNSLEGNVQANSLMGNITVSDALVGNIQANTLMGDVMLQDALIGNVQSGSLMGNITLTDTLTGNVQANSLEGNIILADSLMGDIQTNTLTGNVQANFLIGNITLQNALMGNIQASFLEGNVQADSMEGNITLNNTLTGNVQANALKGNITVSDALEGNITVTNTLMGNVQANALVGNIALTDSLVGDVQANALIGNVQTNSLTGNINISKELTGHFQAGKIVAKQLDQPAIAVDGDIFAKHQAISVQGLVKSDNEAGVSLLAGIESFKDGVSVQGSITSNGNGVSVQGSITSNGNGVSVQGSIVSTHGNGILVIKSDDAQPNVIQGGVGTRSTDSTAVYPGDNNYAAINITGNIYSGNDTIVITGDVKSKWYSGIHITGDVQVENDQTRSGAYGIHIEGNVLGYNGGIKVTKQIRSFKGRAAIMVGEDFKANSSDANYKYAVQGYENGIMVQNGIKTSTRCGIYVNGNIMATGSNGYGIHVEGGSITSSNSAFAVRQGNLTTTGSMATINISAQPVQSGQTQKYAHVKNTGSGKAVHIDGDVDSLKQMAIYVNGQVHSTSGDGINVNGGINIDAGRGYALKIFNGTTSIKGLLVEGDVVAKSGNEAIEINGSVISEKGIAIHVNRTVQSKLDGIVVSGVENDGIRSAISSGEGYALNISGNINAAGGLLVQNGNISTNGELLDSSEEPYAGVRMKCVQDPETNKCAVGGYIITKDAFGVWLEGGVQTTIVGGKGESIRLGDVKYLKDSSSEASLGTAIEIGNVESDGSGVSIDDVRTQDGSGISAQHVVSNEGHAIVALTATSEYASVNTDQSGSEYPSVIQVRHVETTSPSVEGIRVAKVSTNTGTAIHVYETKATDYPTEPGTISSEGIGIKVGDNSSSDNAANRIHTTNTVINVQGSVESDNDLGVSLNGNVDSQKAGISVSGKITSGGNGVSVTNGIASGGIGLTITAGGIDSKMDAIRVRQTNTDQPAISSVSDRFSTINITGDVKSTKYTTVVINGNVQSDDNSTILINGGVITHAKDSDVDSDTYDDYYAFKADYIDASQYGSSPIKSGPYGVHVGWIKSYNDSIHISGADTDGNALLSNASTIKVANGNLVGSRRGIVLTKAQNETLQKASSLGDTNLTNAKKELVGNLSTSAVVDLGGNISLIGFNTAVTVQFPNDTSDDSLYDSYNNRFSPIHMLRVGGNITGGTNSNINSNGIWVDGSIRVSGSVSNDLINTQGNAININGNVSGIVGVHIVENVINGQYGFLINGAISGISTTAILIQNKNYTNNNKIPAILAQNGLVTNQGDISYSNYGIRISNGGVVSKSGTNAIYVAGNVESDQTAITVTGDVKQTSTSYKSANAIRVQKSVQSYGNNAIQIDNNVIGAKSGILVTGNIISNASNWNCSTQCQSGHDSEPCQTCISDMFNSNSNKANVYDDIPAAINVAGIQGQRLAYGIHVWENISTVNDSIKINNYKNGVLAINSSQGSNIIINGSMLAGQSAIKVNGSLNSTGYNDTIHIDGVVYNDFLIENITRCDDDQGNITYTDESTAEIDHISAVYIKDIQTKLGENNTELTPVQDDQHEGTCYSGYSRGAEGLIVSTIKSFNNSFRIQESIHSDSTGIQIDPKAHVFGGFAAIYSGMCSTLESDDATLQLEGVSVITNNDDRFAVEFVYVYMNTKDYYNIIDLNKWNDTCPA